ncbi:choline dehydrogenase-like flavoprotein [Pedobacter africanus]|uniref:Choline dehydrogenase-like flavoprotein n=1 Tax=Pedobacter africanus TaxID=151894 RepID=A0ACC6KTG3_9SPHI|nr:GMC oxidoreductase [Pedobacter africanus]MDR6782477.1 choline dehydrogenase-like flavoprotein [Pedobacter africanus]
MRNEDYDLIVVGTSFASTFFLKKYLSKAGTGNKKVLVLERGHFYAHEERLKVKRGIHSEYEKYEEPWQEAINNVNPKKLWPFTTGYGGCSNCWWGCTPRFMPSDFKMKSLFRIEQDWPITYEDLDAYYYEAEELMSVSGPESTPFPRTGKYPLPPHTFSLVDKILHKTYGSQYISQPTARASRATKGRNGCMASSTCDTCPVNAKFTIENSGIDVYKDERVTLVYGAQVFSLELVNNVAKSVYYIKDGKTCRTSAEVIALGANPFFNTNILLNAGDTNRLTGKGFGEQLGMQVLIYLDNMSNAGGSTWVNANGYMLYDGAHRKDFAACLMEVSNAPYYIRLERGKWLNIASIRMLFEDLPQDINYITTTANKLVPKVNFQERSAYTLKGIENMKKKLPDILSCLPVEKLKYLEPFPNEGHIIGGTRMSKDAGTGVVDRHLIHHQYRNLFVLGAGAFTTYSASNPTLTLSALSLFAADKSF